MFRTEVLKRMSAMGGIGDVAVWVMLVMKFETRDMHRDATYFEPHFEPQSNNEQLHM